jgi:hypothetical protein
MPSLVGLIGEGGSRSRRTSDGFDDNRAAVILGCRQDTRQDMMDATRMRSLGERLEKIIRKAWPQKSRAVALFGGRKEEKKKRTRYQRELVGVLGNSWPNGDKRVKACFGRFAQKEVILETAGFVSRDFSDPRWKRNWSWLAECGRAQ